MSAPDIQAIQHGDAAAWDMAFPWLWPAAFGAAQVTLQPYLRAEIEDVAIESLEALVEKVRELKSVEELKPLVARQPDLKTEFERLQADVRLAREGTSASQRNSGNDARTARLCTRTVANQSASNPWTARSVPPSGHR